MYTACRLAEEETYQYKRILSHIAPEKSSRTFDIVGRVTASSLNSVTSFSHSINKHKLRLRGLQQIPLDVSLACCTWLGLGAVYRNIEGRSGLELPREESVEAN